MTADIIITDCVSNHVFESMRRSISEPLFIQYPSYIILCKLSARLCLHYILQSDSLFRVPCTVILGVDTYILWEQMCVLYIVTVLFQAIRPVVVFVVIMIHDDVRCVVSGIKLIFLYNLPLSKLKFFFSLNITSQMLANDMAQVIPSNKMLFKLILLASNSSTKPECIFTILELFTIEYFSFNFLDPSLFIIKIYSLSFFQTILLSDSNFANHVFESGDICNPDPGTTAHRPGTLPAIPC